MAESSFIGYVGDADFHDGCILTVAQLDALRVHIRGASGKVFVVDFGGVGAVRANRPEAMRLYALSELRSETPLRRFAFANWDEDSDAYFEVDAENMTVHEM